MFVFLATINVITYKYVCELKKDFIPFWYGQKAALFPRHGSGGCFYFLKVVLFMYLRKDMRYKLVLLSFPVMWVPFHNDHVVVKLLWVREVPNAIRWLKKSSKFYYNTIQISRGNPEKNVLLPKVFFQQKNILFQVKSFFKFCFHPCFERAEERLSLYADNICKHVYHKDTSII